MENIFVDSATGLVGASSVVQYVLPGLSASFVRKVTKEAADKAQLSFSKIKHGGTFVNALSVDDCLEVMANSSQDGIKQWYARKAETFRRDLDDYVTRKTTQVESKESCIQRALRALNIQGSIRVDEESRMGSVIDVIKLICPEKSEFHAYKTLSNLIDDDDKCIGNKFKSDDSTIPLRLSERVKKIQINGRGRVTPVADAKTLIYIIWLLPGRAVAHFRAQSAEIIARVLGGDLRLAQEIQQQCAKLQETPEGRAFQDFMAPDAKKQKMDMFEFLGPSKRVEIAEQFYAEKLKAIQQERQAKEQELKKKSITDIIDVYQSLKNIDVEIDDRTKVEIRDKVSILTRQMEGQGSHASPPLLLCEDPSTPTHVLDAERRGQETNIVVVSAKMNVRVPPALSGKVGKLMRKKYINKYKLPTNWNDFIKRQTILHGRPCLENTYYERDADIIEEAIREVVTV
ncbi:FirrV-1-A33 [Feldmannia irregularis virus a]|uniref:FirrV-1-A33 n=1 Tax=Feldmannia irregularis virus a TaxID=231992 RepID=Q6XM54_9PHYC|nr:FirrV-1-A33 [Feldmannia irregularis virus a]AAR26857.1 FirrV-1-A33 [Feldmannia irregularis virus a]